MKFYFFYILVFIVWGCRQQPAAKPYDDEKNALLSVENIKVPEKLKSYYKKLDFTKNGKALYNELAVHTIAEHTTFLSYRQRHQYLYYIDEDPENRKNVILIYNSESRNKNEFLSGSNPHTTQTFNTEHVYPQSLINNTAKGDLHHLRSCDIQINAKRANYRFVKGQGNFKLTDKSWYPGDDWKGDVARMIMYLSLRYNENFKDVGSLDLFLTWNREDPVSDFERQRNNRIQKIQGNRNPFIDNPFLATRIWGGKKAENSWERHYNTP